MKLFIALVLFILPTLTIACWLAVPLSDVIKGNPVVVHGKITEVVYAPKQKSGSDIATITIDEVLKDETGQKLQNGSKIKLAMPAKNNEMHMSTDLYYNIGKEGFWILEFHEGMYLATYPDDFQPTSARSEVIEAFHPKPNTSKPDKITFKDQLDAPIVQYIYSSEVQQTKTLNVSEKIAPNPDEFKKFIAAQTLNKQCSFLNDEDTKDFEKNIVFVSNAWNIPSKKINKPSVNQKDCNAEKLSELFTTLIRVRDVADSFK